MNADSIVLGIDTSNYTTSVALVTLGGEVVACLRKPLPVREGERGLRQSEATFAHVKNLPEIMNEARAVLGGSSPIAVGVSTRPRNVEGSYMPCFLSGVAAAESISCACNLPLFRFSHQCGHVMAALYSCGAAEEIGDTFAAFHVSGGTTELIRATKTENGFSSELVGGTNDLNAGQIIDRVGVYMGIPFPSGQYLDKMSSEYSGKGDKKKISVKGMNANLSGLENMAKKLYDETKDKARVGAFVFNYIGETLSALRGAYEERYGSSAFVFAGGVMSNSIIRKRLSSHARSYFAEPSLSTDNAVGIAILARDAYLKSI